MDIGNIKAYMKKRKITYQYLSEKSGVSLSAIKKIFAGISNYPRIDTIRMIEKALNIEGWSDAELEQGIASTANVKITPIEDELLSVGREISNKLGETALRGYITIGEGILKNSK